MVHAGLVCDRRAGCSAILLVWLVVFTALVLTATLVLMILMLARWDTLFPALVTPGLVLGVVGCCMLLAVITVWFSVHFPWRCFCVGRPPFRPAASLPVPPVPRRRPSDEEEEEIYGSTTAADDDDDDVDS